MITQLRSVSRSVFWRVLLSSALHRRFDTIREDCKIAQDLIYPENLIAQAHSCSTASIELPFGDCQRAGLKTLFCCGEYLCLG